MFVQPPVGIDVVELGTIEPGVVELGVVDVCGGTEEENGAVDD